MYVPEEILFWREGDPITLEHRRALASYVAQAYNLSKEKEAEELASLMKLSDEHMSESLAVMIATVTQMDMKSFIVAFPKTAAESKSEAVEFFLNMNFTDDKKLIN